MAKKSAGRYASLIRLMLVVLLIRFYPMLLNKTLYFGDNYSLFVPGRIFTASWLKQGILPLWNPTILGGINWVGNIDQSIIYPTTLLFLWFKPGIALNLTVILHLLLSMLGMYVLTLSTAKNQRSATLAALIWGLSAPLTGSLNNLSTLQSMAWLPWVIYTGQYVGRWWRDSIWFAVMVTLDFWGGYPQYALFGVSLAILFSFMNSKLRFRIFCLRWLLTGVISIGLSAALLFPFLQTIRQSTRTDQSADQAMAGSLQPLQTLTFIVPYLFNQPQLGMKWGPAWSSQTQMVLYITWFGLSGLILGLGIKANRTRHNLILMGLILVTLVMAFGGNLPGYREIYLHLPIINLGRYPSMILVVTQILLTLLLANLIPVIKISPALWRRLSLVGILITGIALGIWLIDVIAPQRVWQMLDSLSRSKLSQSPFHTLSKDTLILRVILSNIGVNALSFTLAWGCFYWKKWRSLLWVIALDLMINTGGLLFFGPESIYDQPGKLMALLRPAGTATFQNYRSLTRNMNQPYSDYGMYWDAMTVRSPFSDSFVDSRELADHHNLMQMKQTVTPNWNMVTNLNLINGYATLMPRDFAALWSNPGEVRINFLNNIDPLNNLAKTWAVKYYLVDKQFKVNEDLTALPLVYSDPQLTIREVPGALPRIRWTDGTAAPVGDYREDPNTITFKLTSTQPQTLIVADRYDPNWQAKVDHQVTKIENSAGMRQIKLSPGTHRVVFSYTPKLFYLGCLMTLLTGLVMVGYLVRYNRS